MTRNVDDRVYCIKGSTEVILVDFKYFAANIDELFNWCEQHRCIIEGMMVSMPDEHTLTLFMLRWA